MQPNQPGQYPPYPNNPGMQPTGQWPPPGASPVPTVQPAGWQQVNLNGQLLWQPVDANGQPLWLQGQPVYYTQEQINQMQFEAYTRQEPAAPTMQQPLPPQTGKPPRKRKKGGLKSLLAVVLALTLVAGAAWYLLKGRSAAKPQMATAVLEKGSLGTTYSGDALIVRNETAYDEEGVQNIEFVAEEGSVVYRGDVICYVYSTGYSSKEMITLQDLRDSIKTYQETLLKSETAYDQKMTRLENEVVQRGLEVRSLVQGARGNLLNQETILKAAIEQRQNYFRSKYSSDMRLNRLFDDETTQQQRIDSWIRQKVAMQESIVSFYTDGFEQALSPSSYETYTPAQVRAMMNGEKPATSTAARGRTNLYRLVKKGNYAVLMLVRDTTWNPVEGSVYKLSLEQYAEGAVEARILSFTRSGGELLLRLAVHADVEDVLYMRTCQAQLGEYVDCMVVPEGALYTQSSGGDAAVGVVLVDGNEQYFVPVTVHRQEGGKAYISAIQLGLLSEGQTVRLFK